MKNIIVDFKTINDIETNQYDKVFLIGYGKDNIDNLMMFTKHYDNIEVILPTSNFDKAYRLINKHIANLVNNDLELLSLFKLCKYDLFNLGMIMVVLNSKSDAKILTQYNSYLLDLKIIQQEQIKLQNNIKINIIKQIAMLIVINVKAIGMYLKSFVLKANKTEILLMDYPTKNILGNLEDNQNTMIIDINSIGQFITWQGLVKFFNQQKKLLLLSFKYKILSQNIAKQSFYILKAISLVNFYKPKIILGTLDASIIADLYSSIFKSYNIKFGCYSHGYNYDFRTEYIYIPFDFYFIWSQIHLDHIQKGTYIKNNCKFYITGSPLYKNFNFPLLREQTVALKYDILVIGEYYYDNYALQPFNSQATLKLAEVLKTYSKQYNICIRPRMDDQYYKDMYSVLGDSVTYSFPKNQSEAKNSMIDDIQASKIILGVYTAGLNDALLLNKFVIHINFIGIEEPRYFNINNAKYYANNGERLQEIINRILSSDMINSKFDMNKYYFNDAIYDMNIIQKVLNVTS